METGRVTSPGAEEDLGKEFRVLDRGFVRLVNYMGDDSSIVQAARVSYGAGTKKAHEDRGLIRYLMRHRHTTPFEMVEFQWHVKLPIFVARQWIRHRTANVNEYSGRYSVMKEEFYIPNEDRVQLQSQSNKQGSEGEVSPELRERFLSVLLVDAQLNFDHYKEFEQSDIARELVRIGLPLSTYTEWYWKIDLHNLFHFLNLRLDKHAQEEIRLYSEVMANTVKKAMPVAYEAFEDYVLNSVSLSGLEIEVIKGVLNGNPFNAALENSELSKREKTEFLEKWRKLSV
ncbi:MAG: FAD-dependent thymidylate synthase [Nanoarchaeota archaeon]